MSPLDDCGRVDDLLVEAEACADPDEGEYLRQQAVLMTIDLADAVSRRYFGRGVDPDDVIQVGRLALVKAARGYRCGHGSGFAAYAVPTISGEIKRYFRDCGWTVRPPRRLQELRAELASAQERLRQELQREPTDADLAQELDVDPDSVAEVRECSAAYHALSLDAPGPTGTLADVAGACCGEIEDVESRDALRQVLSCLSDRDQLIVRLRFVEELTQAEIGQVLGVSQMQVSRLLASILGRLRTGMEASAAA
jgi:RNA polymerase sigma-B factor